MARLLFACPSSYAVCPLLVIVRDPTGRQRDDFLFSTDLDTPAERLSCLYASRWPIEDSFRNNFKLGGEILYGQPGDLIFDE